MGLENKGRLAPMKTRAIRHCALLGLMVVLATQTAPAAASSLEISDLFSSMESADITVNGEGAGALQMDLIHDGEKIASRNLVLDGPGTWAIRWPSMEAEEGSYDFCASLVQNHTTHQLNIKMTHVKYTISNFTHYCKCFRKNIINGFAMLQAFPKFSCFRF